MTEKSLGASDLNEQEMTQNAEKVEQEQYAKTRALFFELTQQRRLNLIAEDLHREDGFRSNSTARRMKETKVSDDVEKERTEGMEGRVTRLEVEFEHISKSLADIKDEFKSLKSDNKATRTTIIVTALGSLLTMIAVVVGLVQLGKAQDANMLSAFQLGLGVSSAPHKVP